MKRRDEESRPDCTYMIRDLNDRLRKAGVGGKLMLTRAVAALEQQVLQRLIAAVREFDEFKPGNDPWGEHDFGSVQIDSETYFWKIDTYDVNLEWASPDRADETVTRRVLTIMTGQDL